MYFHLDRLKYVFIFFLAGFQVLGRKMSNQNKNPEDLKIHVARHIAHGPCDGGGKLNLPVDKVRQVRLKNGWAITIGRGSKGGFIIQYIEYSGLGGRVQSAVLSRTAVSPVANWPSANPFKCMCILWQIAFEKVTQIVQNNRCHFLMT